MARTRGSNRRDLIALVISVAVLAGLIWGGVTVWRAFWYESPCEQAQGRVDTAMQATAMFRGDAHLLAELSLALRARDELGCTS